MFILTKNVYLYRKRIKMNKKINSTKYRDIMKTAHDLFWKHGFRRVSIEEICRKAGVSKMTFYRFFPNKIELAKTVFREVIDEGMQRFKDIMDADITGAEKIKRIILLKAEGTNDISREFMEDFYLDNEFELKSFVEAKIMEATQVGLRVFGEAQQNGIIRNDVKLEFMFAFSTKAIEIMHDEKLLKMFNTPQDMIMEFIKIFIYGILSHEEA